MTTHAGHAEDHPYRGHLPGRARRWQTLEGLAVPIELQPAARQAPGCQRLDASGGGGRLAGDAHSDSLDIHSHR